MNIEELPWNPERVLHGLSRIGYSPVEAILDLVDNSVSAKATEVHVVLETGSVPSASGRGRPRIVLEEVRITDNGCGMNKSQLRNALALGSDESRYELGTLSKFGLGMKSAAGSLGKRTSVVSATSVDRPVAGVLDHDLIKAEKRYVCKIGDHEGAPAPAQAGTTVVIDKLHGDLPPYSEIEGELEQMLGMTYYYFLVGRRDCPPLTVTLNGRPIAAFDPLFESEVSDSDIMDEASWNGRTVMWLCKPRTIQVTDSVVARFSATQLPHPPSFARSGPEELSQSGCRDKYGIDAKRYGIYIYRNGRLIGKAADLGLITRDQDLYSYRARLEITSAADDALHIDVAKSSIQLSAIAKDQLTEIVRETVSKSKAAWNRAKRRVEQDNEGDATGPINRGLDEFARDTVADERAADAAAPASEREGRKRAAVIEAERNPPTPQELEDIQERQRRVLYEPFLPENQLWGRKYHAVHGALAVVNSAHRFATDVLQSDAAPASLRRAFEVLIFALAEGERQLLRDNQDDRDKVARLMEDYRASVGAVLSIILRRFETDILRD